MSLLDAIAAPISSGGNPGGGSSNPLLTTFAMPSIAPAKAATPSLASMNPAPSANAIDTSPKPSVLDFLAKPITSAVPTVTVPKVPVPVAPTHQSVTKTENEIQVPSQDYLNKEADSVDAMRKSLDTTSQAAIDVFNEKVDKFNEDVKTYNSQPAKISDEDTKSIIASGGSILGPDKGTGLSYDQLPASEKAKIQANILFPTELTPEQQKNNINIKIPFTASRYASIPAPATSGEPGVTGSANPLISFVANIPSAIVQAIPRMIVTLSEEKKGYGTDYTKELGPVESRLYGEPEFKNTYADAQARIARGDGILSAYLGAVSSKVADVAVGAQVAAQGFRSLASVLSGNDDVAHIEAWKTLGSPQTPVEAAQNYRALAHQFHPDLNPGISDETIKVLNKAKTILDDKGIPTKANTSAQTAAKYFEVLGRETKLGQPFKDADIAPKEPQGKDLGAKRLPGSAPVAGQSQPIGLSTQEVEHVGGESDGQPKQQELPTKVPETASDIVGDGSDLHAIEANTAKYVEANKDSLINEYKARNGNVFSVDNMKKALATGHKVQIAYVEQSPENLIRNLVKRASSGGRTVPIETTYNTLQSSRRNVFRINGKLGSNPNFSVAVIDARGNSPVRIPNGLDFLKSNLYSDSDIARFKADAYAKTQDLYEKGKISEKVYQGLIRRKPGASVAGGQTSRLDGEEFEQKAQGRQGEGKEVAPKEDSSKKLDQLHRQLDRNEQSLKAATENPVGHAKAYGGDMKPEYQANIDRIKSEISSIESKGQKFALDQKVLEVKAHLDIAKEALRNHPAKGLVKYANFKTGELPEVLGKGGLFGKRGDQIASEFKFKDSEEARDSYQNYLGERTKVVVLEQQYKGLRDLQKDEKLHQEAIDSANRFLEKSNGAMGKGLEVAARARMKERMQEMATEAEKRKQAAHANLRTLEQVLKTESPALDNETLSIEAQALQAANIEYSQLPSLPKISIDVSTSVKQKVGALDYFRTPDRVLEKIGMGKNAKEVRTAYENYLSELPQHINLLREWTDRALKHSGSDFKIFQYLDGTLKKSWDAASKSMRYDMKPEEYLVAEEIKAYLKEWADRLDLPEDNQIGHYITHIFERQAVTKEFDEDLAKLIVNKVPGSVYDPFLEKRTNAPNYVQSTRRAVEAYIKRAVRKANMDPALESLKERSKNLELSQLEYVKKFADRLNMRPTWIDNAMDNTIKQMFGYRLGQRPTARITGAWRRMIYRGAIGLNFNTAIKVATQGVNTYAKLGEKYTGIGYVKMITLRGDKELTESGVLNSVMTTEDMLPSASHKFLQSLDKGLFSMFQLVHKANRAAAYWGAKQKYIDDHTRPTGPGQSVMPSNIEQKAIEYAKKMVRDTQFSFGKIDTPVGLSSDIAKTVLQFGSYATKQTEFLAEMGKNKEWAGMIRYVLASIFIIYTVGKAFNITADNFSPLGYFFNFGLPKILALPKVIYDSITGAKDQFGKVPTIPQRLKNVGQAALPYVPGGMQIQKTVQGIQAFKSSGGSGALGAANAAAFGKSSVSKSSGSAANNILAKYGLGKSQNKSQASAILKKYGIK